MAGAKREQSGTMLYVVITFVVLFVISTAAAVIFYIQFEDQKKAAQTATSQLEEMASPAEQRNLGNIVGARQGRTSRLSTMIGYVDHLMTIAIGGVPEQTSAEVKVDLVSQKVKESMVQLNPIIFTADSNDPNSTGDANGIGLVRVIQKLNSELKNSQNNGLALNQQLTELKNRFDDAMAAHFEKEQTLLAEKEKYRQEVNEITKSYAELKELTQQTADQQMKTVMDQLSTERSKSAELTQKLLKTEAQLKIGEERVRRSQEKLQALVPPPDQEITAFKPDGKIISVDNSARVVTINLGSDNRVYPGLTFSIYDALAPIPRDGRGKAEVKVFDVAKTYAIAQITDSIKNRPVLAGDAVANLIWDSERVNEFVVAGEFDLNGDGTIDEQGEDKAKLLITRWGAKVTDAVSVDTDFIVLGKAPDVRAKPTFEQMEADPLAMQKYEQSLKRLADYKEIQQQAQALSVPIFNLERFLYFAGYKSLAGRAGAW